MSVEQPFLNRDAVAALLNVELKTVSQYLTESRLGGRYAQHPFPAPGRPIGRAPWCTTIALTK